MFSPLPKNRFFVEVHDYLSDKDYRFDKSFNTYFEAENFIKSFNFKDDFHDNPIGIFIIELPSLSFDTGVFNGNFEK